VRFKSVKLPIQSISASLKDKIRRGVPNAIRLPIWFASITGTSLNDHDGAADFMSSNFTHTLPALLARFGLRDASVFTYTDPGLLQLLLNAFVDGHPSVIVAPLVPLAASLLLYRMDPPIALFLLDAMLTRGIHFTTDEITLAATLHVIEGWICGKCHQLMAWIDRMPFRMNDILRFVLPSFFMTTVDIEVALTLFDVYLSEGRRVLTGLSARLVATLEPDLIKCDDWDAVCAIITGFLRGLSHPTILADFLGNAFKIATPAGAEEQALLACRALSCTRIGCGGGPQPESARTLPVSSRRSRPVIRRLAEAVVVDAALLAPRVLAEVRRALPPQMDRYQRAVRRYRMTVDGTVLSALISRSVDDGLWILLCGTEHRVVGAAFTGSLSLALARRGKFVEQGFAVVFAAEGDSVRVFKKAESGNSSLYSVDATGIAFGAPRPALYLAADFRTVASAPSETFGSPSLVNDPDVGDVILEAELFQLVMN
jgi:hypothetical protein